jgi:4-hydroxy-3-methylbut-2-enyl diphosphate reductase
VKELSKEADIMIIIGGKNSSNTKQLYLISKEN